MDISHTLEPNSDQLDAVELVGSPRTFVIESVSRGSAEQPVNVHFVDFPRPWRPGKSMRRVLAACWSADASTWVGRSVTLFCDPEVRFGGAAVGGVRVSALSHIEKPVKVPLLVSRGKSAIFTVQPLANAPKASEPTPEQIAGTTDKTALRAMWNATNNADLRAQITARVAELDTANGEQP